MMNSRRDSFLTACEYLVHGSPLRRVSNALDLENIVWNLQRSMAKRQDSQTVRRINSILLFHTGLLNIFILESLGEIGLKLPQMEGYGKIYTESIRIQDILAWVVEIIKDFLLSIAEISLRPSWKKMIDPGRGKLEPIMHNLQQHWSLLENQARLVDTQRNEEQRRQLAMSAERAELDELNRHTLTIIEKLSPADSATDQWKCSMRRNKNRESGSWLIKNEILLRWLEHHDDRNCTIWLKGGAGAGKTILASRIVEHLQFCCKDAPVLFFYFRKYDSLRNSLAALMRGLLAQLVQYRPDHTPYVYNMLTTGNQSLMNSEEALMMGFRNCLGTQGAIWMVLDGLQECERKERKQIISWVLRTQELISRTSGYFKVFITSQDKPEIPNALYRVPLISLHEPEHQEDIRRFVLQKATKLSERLGAPMEIREQIVQRVSRHANGIFLFARLAYNYLRKQDTWEDLQAELNSDDFPTHLDEIVQKLYSTQSNSEFEELKQNTGDWNSSLIESLIRVRENQLPFTQRTSKQLGTYTIEKDCATCKLLKLRDSHFKIPLIKLMLASISCEVCHTICKSILLLDQHWLQEGHGSSVLEIEKRQGVLCFQIQTMKMGEEFFVDKKWGFPLILHMFSRGTLGDPWNNISIHQPISSHSGSDQCIGKIQGWLSACENEHHQCSKESRRAENQTDGTLVAARVIDLGASAHITPRLISTEGLHISKWTALSYCWGGVRTFITTTINIEERQQPIPWASIPKTFQDAMTLTHRLDVRYIWIDAVCIIQDSKSDWASEAKKMANIYQNAHFVIAADLAESCDSGIFASRERYSIPVEVNSTRGEKTQAYEPIYVEKGSSLDYTSQKSEPSEWHTGAFLRHRVLESNCQNISNRWRNPTLQRAWCFQERMLASRIIHFTAAELIWECKSKIDCECGLRNSTEVTLKQSLDTSLKMAAATQHPEFMASPTIASRMWWKLVVEYSSLELTSASDKLPAISGLARLFPKLGMYWAGMWSNELPSSLLWREEASSNSPGLEADGKVVSMAPSWSWASTKNPLHETEFNATDVVAEVLNINDKHEVSDVYGQILDVRLVLKSLLLDGVVRFISNSFFGTPLTEMQLVSRSGEVLPGMEYGSSRMSVLLDSRVKISGETDLSTYQVKCIVIKSTMSQQHGRVLECLILRKHALQNNFFERIGLLTCMDNLSESEIVFRETGEVTII